MADYEPIEFSAELYDDNFERVNAPEVVLRLKNAAGENYDYTFNRYSDYYRLDCGYFTNGVYRYKASTSFNGKKYSQDGRLTVEMTDLELAHLTADHNLLYALSEKSGGKLFYPTELNLLAQALKQNTSLRPVVYSSFERHNLLSFKWLFLPIFLLLGLEWFLRRYWGHY